MELRSKIVIDTKAIVNNVRLIKKILKPSTKMMAVVKANGYGHDSVESARAAIYAGAEYLGVATAEEGLLLRKNGFNAPILVLGAAFKSSGKDCVQNLLAQTVFDYDTACEINETASLLNKKAVVHIKADTGMNRIGFSLSDKSIGEIKRIYTLKNITIEGIYSHFAESDADNKAFSEYQARLFIEFCGKLEKDGIHIPVKHMSNSAAVLTLPEFQFDMVRPGIIIYGLPPARNIDVRSRGFIPAMSFYSEVTHLKDIPKGVSVGYNRSFYSADKMRVATIPIGYADSYPRLLSNSGKVIINGKYADIIGNICMDQMMADVTGIEDIKQGDEVILIGKHGVSGIEVTAEEIAEKANTINYEAVCSIGTGKRSKKIYL